MPIRYANRHWLPTARPTSAASQMPRMLVAWKIPEAWARAWAGKTSATKAAATAHSPPTPSATRNRSTATCQISVAKYVSPENIE